MSEKPQVSEETLAQLDHANHRQSRTSPAVTTERDIHLIFVLRGGGARIKEHDIAGVRSAACTSGDPAYRERDLNTRSENVAKSYRRLVLLASST